MDTTPTIDVLISLLAIALFCLGAYTASLLFELEKMERKLELTERLNELLRETMFEVENERHNHA